MFSFSFLFFKRKLLLEPSCMEHGDWRRFIGAGLLIDAQSRRRGVSLSLSLFLFGGAGARGVASEIVRSIVATSRWSTCLAPSVGNDSFWFHFCFCFFFLLLRASVDSPICQRRRALLRGRRGRETFRARLKDAQKLGHLELEFHWLAP